MGRHREASLVLEEASKMDPLNCQIRLHLEAATQGVLKDLLAGAFSFRARRLSLTFLEPGILALSQEQRPLQACKRACVYILRKCCLESIADAR